jgi:hypothetical protein
MASADDDDVAFERAHEDGQATRGSDATATTEGTALARVSNGRLTATTRTAGRSPGR